MKSISADNYTVNPFVTHKTQTYTYEFLGIDNKSQIAIDLATFPPLNIDNWMWNEPINPSGIGQYTLFSSIEHLFYQSGSFWNMGGGFSPVDTVYVVSIAQLAYGEGIFPGTVVISSADSSNVIKDDGYGKLVVNPGGAIVGNIFYGLGIAIIQGTTGSISPIESSGMMLTTGSNVTVVLGATQTIYEHQVICTMEAGENNYSVNPTITETTLSGELPLDLVASGSLAPYMTIIGLYNDQNELMATGKFPRPLKRAFNGQQTVIIKFDV